MDAKRWVVVIALLGLVVAALACDLPAPLPAEPTPTTYVPPEPTPSEGAPPRTPTEALSPTPEATTLLEGALRVAYVSDGNLWLVEGEAPARQLTSGGADSAVLLSPDGRRILFRRELPPGPADLPRFELRVIDVDGSGERRLVGPEDLPGEMGIPMGSDAEVLLDWLPMQVDWLPDGRAIAFNTHVEFGYGLAHHDDLWLVDVETGALTQLLPDGEGGIFAFSPDGTHLVVSTPTTVTMMDADGGNRRTLLTFDFVNTASEYAYRPMPVWAPDGSYALVAISSAEPFGPQPSGDLWHLPPAGDAVRLATLPGEFVFNTQDDRLWSPDRARIAYAVPAIGDDPNARDFVIADGDGSTPVVYATGQLEFLGWAADSSRFTFWQNRPGEIYLGQVGAPPVRLVPLAEARDVFSVQWVDGETFAYVASVGEGVFEIRVGQVGGPHRTIAASLAGFPQLDVHRWGREHHAPIGRTPGS
jgi:dipeptidyl aminopeptidase/acylaminoacyl peptidase